MKLPFDSTPGGTTTPEPTPRTTQTPRTPRTQTPSTMDGENTNINDVGGGVDDVSAGTAIADNTTTTTTTTNGTVVTIEDENVLNDEVGGESAEGIEEVDDSVANATSTVEDGASSSSSSSTTSTLRSRRRVHFIPTRASMLGIDDDNNNGVYGDDIYLNCTPPVIRDGVADDDDDNDDDTKIPTCPIGGMSSAAAYQRYYSGVEPSVLVPWVVTDTKFVFINWLGAGVNLVFPAVYNTSFFLAPPSFVAQSVNVMADALTLTYALQYEDYPIVLTNILLPFTNTWKPYIEHVHFDETTGLAILHVTANQYEAFGAPEIETTVELLRYVARVNANNDCFVPTNKREEFSAVLFFNLTDTSERQCWIPVIVYDNSDDDAFHEFVNAISNSLHATSLILDVTGKRQDEYGVPIEVNSTGTWVVSHPIVRESYYHLTITKDENHETTIQQIDTISADLSSLPSEAMDEKYYEQVQETQEIYNYFMFEKGNSIVGYTGPMPGPDTTTMGQCHTGECPMGNMFADSVRLASASDVAFLASNLFQGSGWTAGEVRLSNLWDAMPSMNLICNDGYMTGLSLYNLLDASLQTQNDDVSAAETTTTTALQLSGILMTYNSNLRGTSKIISIDVWDYDRQAYLPLNRSKLYTFATDSYVSSVLPPFPDIFDNSLDNEGERPCQLWEYTSIMATQWVLNDTTAIDTPYDTSIEGRLVNDPTRDDVLQIIQTSADCDPGKTYWSQTTRSCEDCPDYNKIFLTKQIFIDGAIGGMLKSSERLIIGNNESFGVNLLTVTGIPEWMILNSTLGSTQSPMSLGSESNITLGPLLVDSTILPVGTHTAQLMFAFGDASNHPGCRIQRSSQVTVQVDPNPDLNQLGWASLFGFIAAAAIALICFSCAVWVHLNRKSRVVTAMQPVFLLVICFGVFVFGSSLISYSIGDDFVSKRGCDMACMSHAWLLSIGATVTSGAFFAKLWRINRLFNEGRFRRVNIKERDVILPPLVIVALNVILLLAWTITSPLYWQRSFIDDEAWNSYGHCTFTGTASVVFMSLVTALSFMSLGLACYQACVARNISSEFSESKYLGIALFSCVQLTLVGVPVYILIEPSNRIAKYSLLVGLIFAVSLSVLLVVFIPLIIIVWTTPAERPSRVHISGLDGAPHSEASTNPSGGVRMQNPGFPKTANGTHLPSVLVHESNGDCSHPSSQIKEDFSNGNVTHEHEGIQDASANSNV